MVHGLSVAQQCNLNGGTNAALVASNLHTATPVWRKPGQFTVLAGDSDSTSAQHLYAGKGKTVLDLTRSPGPRCAPCPERPAC